MLMKLALWSLWQRSDLEEEEEVLAGNCYPPVLFSMGVFFLPFLLSARLRRL